MITALQHRWTTALHTLTHDNPAWPDHRGDRITQLALPAAHTQEINLSA